MHLMKMLPKFIFLLLLNTILIVSACEGQQVEKLHTNGKTFSGAVLDSFFVDLMDSLNIPGLSIALINDGQIVHHSIFGRMMSTDESELNKQTFFEAASLSKPLFAFFVMQQVDKGVLDLDRPLYEYLPYPDIAYDERYQQITARMILAHTSGFPNWRSDSLTIDFTPGTKHQYSGEGYRYLADVVAAINKVEIEKLDSIFQADVAAAIGVPNLHFKWNEKIAANKATGHINGEPTDNDPVREDLHFGAAGGLYTEASGYAGFLRALMHQELLSPSAYAAMFQEQVALPAEDINAILMNASGWSLGFGMIPVAKETCYWHSGNNGDYQSWFHFFPAKKYGIVLFTNSDKIQTPAFLTRLFEFLDDGITFDMSKLE